MGAILEFHPGNLQQRWCGSGSGDRDSLRFHDPSRTEGGRDGRVSRTSGGNALPQAFTKFPRMDLCDRRFVSQDDHTTLVTAGGDASYVNHGEYNTKECMHKTYV